MVFEVVCLKGQHKFALPHYNFVGVLKHYETSISIYDC
jgi:hypothetical protein